jgi:hypothetical protein
MACGNRFALLAIVGLLAWSTGTASGSLLPSGWTVTPESGRFRWSYAIVLPTDSQLKTGDYFTIYDFGGFVPGTAVAPTADWQFTTQDTGPTAPHVLPVDDPAKPNLNWKYTGPTINTGQIGLGNFMATSLFEDRTESFFAARTHRASDGKIDTNITFVEVPVPGNGLPGLPEPATLALAALGLPLFGLVRLRRKVMA